MELKKIKVLGIIPARKGSKGVINKNFRLVKKNKRLIDYTLIAAKKSKHINKIALTTDDERIIKHSKKYKIDYILKRNKKLSTDHTKSSSVVINTLNRIKDFKADLIILLQPTSPLRNSFHIDEAIRIFCKNYKKYNSLVSVSLLEEPHPFKLKKIQKGFLIPFLRESNSEVPRQSLKKVYKLNGGIYLIKNENFNKKKTFFDKTMPYVMDSKFSLNIDTYDDFEKLKNFRK